MPPPPVWRRCPAAAMAVKASGKWLMLSSTSALESSICSVYGCTESGTAAGTRPGSTSLTTSNRFSSTRARTTSASPCVPLSACCCISSCLSPLLAARAVASFRRYRSEKTGPSQSPCRADATSALSHQSFSFLALSLTVVLLWKNSRGALAQKEKNSCAQL